MSRFERPSAVRRRDVCARWLVPPHPNDYDPVEGIGHSSCVLPRSPGMGVMSIRCGLLLVRRARSGAGTRVHALDRRFRHEHVRLGLALNAARSDSNAGDHRCTRVYGHGFLGRSKCFLFSSCCHRCCRRARSTAVEERGDAKHLKTLPLPASALGGAGPDPLTPDQWVEPKRPPLATLKACSVLSPFRISHWVVNAKAEGPYPVVRT